MHVVNVEIDEFFYHLKHKYLGHGKPWTSRTSSPSVKSEIFANEVEQLRKIFPCDQSVHLQRVFNVCDIVLVATNDQCYQRQSKAGKRYRGVHERTTYLALTQALEIRFFCVVPAP